MVEQLSKDKGGGVSVVPIRTRDTQGVRAQRSRAQARARGGDVSAVTGCAQRVPFHTCASWDEKTTQTLFDGFLKS